VYVVVHLPRHQYSSSPQNPVGPLPTGFQLKNGVGSAGARIGAEMYARLSSILLRICRRGCRHIGLERFGNSHGTIFSHAVIADDRMFLVQPSVHDRCQLDQGSIIFGVESGRPGNANHKRPSLESQSDLCFRAHTLCHKLSTECRALNGHLHLNLSINVSPICPGEISLLDVHTGWNEQYDLAKFSLRDKPLVALDCRV
jgi:hypothetical protein